MNNTANRTTTYANLLERMRKIMEHISNCRKCIYSDRRKFSRLQEEIFFEVQRARDEVKDLAVHDQVMPPEWRDTHKAK